MTERSKAVFLSYASQDAEAARSICEVLRTAGIEVWFDQSELRGGDAWDRQIKKQIHECALFVAIISAHSDARIEGYFRREWRLAVERTHDMADDAPFLLPVVIDDTPDATARVPDTFREVQWTRLPGGATPAAFVNRILRLLVPEPQASEVPPRAAAPVAAHMQAAHGARALSGSRSVLLVVAAAAVVAIGYFALDWWVLSKRASKPVAVSSTAGPAATSAISDKSVAVLPFADMSEKHDQEYFADGMAEEIIERLAKVPELHVPARASSFYFKGKSTKLAEIARELAVANVLEGSVRKSANHLRIGAQLVRADHDFPIWSESYDRELKDVFKVQDEIASAVAAALQITLTGGTLSSETGGTRNLEAYQLFLRAISGLDKNTAAGLKASRDQLEQAVKLDPQFGMAWALLASAWLLMADRGDVLPGEGFERARELAQHAIAISPDLALAHATLGHVLHTYDWNWEAAAAEFHRALAMDAGNPAILNLASLLSMTLGQHDEADRQLRAALARDPLFSYANFNLGNNLYLAGRYAEAEAAFRRVLEIAPDFEWTKSYLAKTLLAEGKPQAALEVLQMDSSDALCDRKVPGLRCWSLPAHWILS